MRVLGNIDVRELLPKVKTPTLIFHSRDDQAVHFSRGEEIARGIPGRPSCRWTAATSHPDRKRTGVAALRRRDRAFFDADDETIVPLEKKPAQAVVDEVHNCMAPDGVRIAYACTGDGFLLVKAPNWITSLPKIDRSNPSYRHWIEECSRSNLFIRSDMRGFDSRSWNPSVSTSRRWSATSAR